MNNNAAANFLRIENISYILNFQGRKHVEKP